MTYSKPNKAQNSPKFNFLIKTSIMTPKEQRHELYAFVEAILGRELNGSEKQTIKFHTDQIMRAHNENLLSQYNALEKKYHENKKFYQEEIVQLRDKKGYGHFNYNFIGK